MLVPYAAQGVVKASDLYLVSTYKRIKQICRFDQPRYDEGGVVLALSTQDLVFRFLEDSWSLMWFNNLYRSSPTNEHVLHARLHLTKHFCSWQYETNSDRSMRLSRPWQWPNHSLTKTPKYKHHWHRIMGQRGLRRLACPSLWCSPDHLATLALI